jgi:hypothetical protein
MLNDLWARCQARLIADVRRAHRLWSVRLSALGAGLSAAWTALPPDTRLAMPAGQWIGLALFLAIGLARIIDQPEARK